MLTNLHGTLKRSRSATGDRHVNIGDRFDVCRDLLILSVGVVQDDGEVVNDRIYVTQGWCNSKYVFQLLSKYLRIQVAVGWSHVCG